MQDDDSFVYDEASGEWISASDAAAKAAASGGAGTTVRHRQIEQQGEVRRDAGAGPGFERGDALHRLAAAAALVGVAGIGETIAQHPASGLQCGRDALAHQLRARGEHHQQFALRTHAAQGRVEQDRAQRFAQRRAAGLARLQQVDALPGQVRMQAGQQGALAGALATLKADEHATHRHWHRLSW